MPRHSGAVPASFEFTSGGGLLPPGDIEHLFFMEFKVKPANFRRYLKTAQCAKKSELMQMGADKITFSNLYNKFLSVKILLLVPLLMQKSL